jgi:hypothetical protein
MGGRPARQDNTVGKQRRPDHAEATPHARAKAKTKRGAQTILGCGNDPCELARFLNSFWAAVVETGATGKYGTRINNVFSGAVNQHISMRMQPNTFKGKILYLI